MLDEGAKDLFKEGEFKKIDPKLAQSMMKHSSPKNGLDMIFSCTQVYLDQYPPDLNTIYLRKLRAQAAMVAGNKSRAKQENEAANALAVKYNVIFRASCKNR